MNNDRRASDERGFSLVETLVATTILTGGMVAVAQLLLVSVQMHQLGRRSVEASYLATMKFEELMKLNFTTAAAVQVTPVSPDSLTQNVANHFDQPNGTNGYTRRWRVQAGPVANTRVVTLRLIPPAADRTPDRTVFREVEITSILRQW